MSKTTFRLSLLSQVIILPFIAVAAWLLFSQAAGYAEINSSITKESARETVEKYAIQCYASEGSYPPDLEYLVENYGLILNEDQFIYEYQIFASNIMPDITVHDNLYLNNTN